jgi:hypothetical protein
MEKTESSFDIVLDYLNNNKIATIEQLKIMLKTSSRMTVFRKLAKLDYLSSCSHSGKFYSLKKTARFNKYGIWRHELVLFSKHGTLKNTLKAMINESSDGFTASELKKILKIKVEDSLCILTKEKSVNRKKISGTFVYLNGNAKAGKKQELTRTDCLQSEPALMKTASQADDEFKAALIIFFSTLDEKQRRLYAGYESLKIGRGGDKLIAEILNLDRKTVAKGRQELLGGKVDVDTIRNSGGGRKNTKKKSLT